MKKDEPKPILEGKCSECGKLTGLFLAFSGTSLMCLDCINTSRELSKAICLHENMQEALDEFCSQCCYAKAEQKGLCIDCSEEQERQDFLSKA